ncbi:uncharacterized protein LOC126926157 isoform X3 [Bombus affinis]|uniref:uncharacterized protein LOC126926157 isoform X3 n=1 Tax=Bombus affinis TaxID=309941 RepID=UPI0021B715BD|nr:uncharacterized protein LOC126926157 isoform X3 [Bombus affinis]
MCVTLEINEYLKGSFILYRTGRIVTRGTRFGTGQKAQKDNEESLYKHVLLYLILYKVLEMAILGYLLSIPEAAPTCYDLPCTVEVFPFVKHTCRMGPEECEVQAGDCAEYARLRECCCHSYLASVWKYLANDAVSPTNTHFIKFLAILTVLRWLL